MTGDAVQLVGEHAVLLQRLAVVDCHHLVARQVEAYRRDGTPAPDRWLALLEALRIAQGRVLASSAGHRDVVPTVPQPYSAQQDTIGSTEAARILYRSHRQVQRIATSLGGRKVASTWVFDRDLVQNYATARDETKGTS